MHRAGDKMLELLAELMARVIDVPVMLVLAGRPDGEWLGRFPGASTVRVSPLGRGDATALADALLPERPWGPRPPPRWSIEPEATRSTSAS